MKKRMGLFVLAWILILFLVPTASAVEWKTTNQATVSWDAVTTYTDGSTIDSGTISYEVFRVDLTDTEKTNAVSLGTTEDVSYKITLTEKGQYYIGVKAYLSIDGEQVSESTIAGSDSAGWGVQYFPALNPPTNLKTE